MNKLEWHIFKTKKLMVFDRIASKIIGTYKARKLYFFLSVKLHNNTKEYQHMVLSRYLRMYQYKRSKERSFDMWLSRNIAIVSNESGVPQHEIRNLVDRIL